MPTPELTLHAGDRVEGFVVTSARPVEALQLAAYELEHERSGARLIHLHADDAENLFSISFPTPPPDDTGLPHILEHAALSGSRNYPVRDPFFEMIKRSMATFINAMTAPDCTYYPVASNVKRDLFNLAEVYFDAVFHPLLTGATFQREGWHLAPADNANPTAGLTINGIVYNEMKGAFSNPESRIHHCASRGLFPDTIYGRESGGDPEHIPDLTYDEFKRFHQTFYHPSNAYFFLYGDVPTVEYLAFLRGRLDAFERLEVKPDIARQPRWSKPRSMEDFYPIGRDEPAEAKTYAQLNWLVGDATDAEDVACLHILSQILLGHEAAPLKKAIIDSKLGQDVFQSGFNTMGLESVFRVGLKGTEPDRTDAFAKLAFDTLDQIAEGAIDRRQVEAALQQAAYHYREIRPMHPLLLMDHVLSGWLYGADPLTFLHMADHLDACRQRYEDDPSFFNRLIRERILDNPHRLTVVLKPDREWQARTDAKFAERMKQARAQFDDDGLRKLAAQAEELERYSGEPNPPDKLALLPQLKLGDLPLKPKHIPTSVETLAGGVELLRNDVFANGVNYLELDFDLDGMPQDLWPYLPRYADAIRKLGAAGMGYEAIARRVASSTGGLGCHPYFVTRADDAASLRGLHFSLKTLDDQIEPALELLRDLIFEVDPRDHDRLHDVVTQAVARCQQNLVHGGDWAATLHAGRGLSPEGYLSELVEGLPQLGLTKGISDGFGERGRGLMDKIEQIRDFILARSRLTASFTGSDDAYDELRSALGGWIGRMRDEPVQPARLDFTPFAEPPREGLAGPVQVAHCAQVIPAPHYSHPDEPLVALGCQLVGCEYMLPEIRLRGGAYGAWCRYHNLESTIVLGSFRDPHIARTLDVFARVPEYVRDADWSQDDVERSIIALAKHDEKPIRPGDATGLALQRHMIRLTPDMREQRYARRASATASEVKRALLGVLDANFALSPICVASSREKLEAANAQMSERPLVIEDILK